MVSPRGNSYTSTPCDAKKELTFSFITLNGTLKETPLTYNRRFSSAALIEAGRVLNLRRVFLFFAGFGLLFVEVSPVVASVDCCADVSTPSVGLSACDCSEGFVCAGAFSGAEAAGTSAGFALAAVVVVVAAADIFNGCV